MNSISDPLPAKQAPEERSLPPPTLPSEDPLVPFKGEDAAGMHPLTILRQSLKFSGAGIIGLLIAVPTSVVVARVLGPETLGMVAFVTVWAGYVAVVRPGASKAMSRELPYRIGQGKGAQAIHSQNVALTVEGLFSFVPSLLLFIGALLARDNFIRVGLLIAATSLFLTSVVSLTSSVHWAWQRFNVQAASSLIISVGTPLITLISIPFLGGYAPLVAPAVVAIAGIIYFRVVAPPIGFRITWDRKEALRLVRVGLPIIMGSLFFWGFRDAGRIMGTAALSHTDLGYFAFAMTFVYLAIGLVSNFGSVLQPRLWTLLGKHGRAQPLLRGIAVNAAVVLALAGVLANVGQAGFAAFVMILVPGFTPSIALFEVLAFTIVTISATILPNLLLQSAHYNRQVLTALLWGAGLIASLITGGAILVSRPGDIVGLAWGLTGVHVVLVAAMYAVSIRLSSAQADMRRRLYAIVAMLGALPFGILALSLAIESSLNPDSLLVAAGVRLAVVLACWLAAALAARRAWMTVASRWFPQETAGPPRESGAAAARGGS